jgi:hypothetical protein
MKCGQAADTSLLANPVIDLSIALAHDDRWSSAPSTRGGWRWRRPSTLGSSGTGGRSAVGCIFYSDVDMYFYVYTCCTHAVAPPCPSSCSFPPSPLGHWYDT